jgi:hypothetical protein
MQPIPNTQRRLIGTIGAVLLLAVGGCTERATIVAPEASADSKSAATPHAPVRLTFEKCLIDAVNWVWEGTVDGDIAGDLRTELRDLRVTGVIWHVRFDWIISAGDRSFTADLDGILNTRTGRVVMNGRVADGYLLGARVHEEGQLVDPENLCFEGTIQVMPATAR